MFSHSLTLRSGVSSARANIPAMLELVRSAKFRPELITTLRAPWGEAHDALVEDSVKVVVKRDPLFN
jgi:threonine dehydrogenase-like Zn-dependent dehydrogenase